MAENNRVDIITINQNILSLNPVKFYIAAINGKIIKFIEVDFFSILKIKAIVEYLKYVNYGGFHETSKKYPYEWKNW